jgi:hypothetical protein
VTTFRELQDEVLLALHGYGLAQPRTTFLVSPISPTDLTATVRNTSDIDMGLAEIDGELVFIETVDRAAGTITFSPDGRGYYGTTAEAHAANTRLTFAPTWPRHRITAAINDVILGVWPTLFGVAQHQFLYTPAVTTYEMPQEAEGVLSVTADTFGPSRQQQVINRYSFSSVAPADEWTTQKSLTLHEAASPGAGVTVTYTKEPSVLSADSDTIAASGLRESARQLLMLGACAQLLSMMDVSRLTVDTAPADELDNRNQIGSAARLANQFQIRFEMEVEKERQRLRESTPPKIKVSYR